MRLVNPGKKPFEFTADSVHYVIKPGDSLEVEDWKGHLAMNQAQILDTTFGDPDGTGEGIPTGDYQIYPAQALSDADVSKLIKYPCPWVQMGHCSAAPFKTIDE